MPYLFTPERYAESLNAIAALASERDMSRFTPYHFVFIAVGDTHAEAHRVAAEQLSRRYRQPFETLVERYCALGTPQECVSACSALRMPGPDTLSSRPFVRVARWIGTWKAMPARSCRDFAKPWARRFHPLSHFPLSRERTGWETANGRGCMLM
jgi:hypothetical protein